MMVYIQIKMRSLERANLPIINSIHFGREHGDHFVG